MSVLARCFGGLRTGDLHTLRWESFDLPGFEGGWAPRQKTRRPQRLTVPESLRPFLVIYWESKESPTSGLMFPVRKGEREGETRLKGASHARELRRDLKHAFGVDQWDGKALGRRTAPDAQRAGTT